MGRKVLIVATTLLAVLVGCYLLVTVWFHRASQDALEATYDAMMASKFSCPRGSVEQVSRWSKVGWTRYCELKGEKEGPWQAWEAEHLAIRGRYSDGERDGTWAWFHSDGSVYRQKTYRHGEELTDQIVAEEPAEH